MLNDIIDVQGNVMSIVNEVIGMFLKVMSIVNEIDLLVNHGLFTA